MFYLFCAVAFAEGDVENLKLCDSSCSFDELSAEFDMLVERYKKSSDELIKLFDDFDESLKKYNEEVSRRLDEMEANINKEVVRQLDEMEANIHINIDPLIDDYTAHLKALCQEILNYIYVILILTFMMILYCVYAYIDDKLFDFPYAMRNVDLFLA